MKAQVFKSDMRQQVKKIAAIFFLIALTYAPTFANRTITGHITDNTTAEALPGVNVLLKGSTTGVVSNINGTYSIGVPDNGGILLFSYLGYQNQEIVIADKDTIDVALAPEIAELDEVVVVGYGVQKRYSLVSACAGLFSKNSAPAPSSYNSTYFNPSTESYAQINENGFKQVGLSPLSTFSIDVDKASYTNVRRFINQGQLPPQDAVRIEEMVNYFTYDYPQPTDKHPFSINTEYADCPWQSGHKLLHIGIQGKKIPTENLPASNLVFLLDVSGSMGEPNKLPLVQAAFKLLVNNLREQDHVAIVVYAGAAGIVLPSTKGSNKTKIIDALNSLEAGGSTAGGEGIELAYKVAQQNFIKNGNNRVILATDGDFNVGISNENELEDYIAAKRKTGIFLTCLGFGMGNYKDSKIEILADKGNGNYAYIDDITEANRVFVNEFGGTLFTIAKDVKIQIEFNPTQIQAYRLIGYENRLLNNEDFKDDTKDAGELGSGHTVTAIYEVIPVGVDDKYVVKSDSLKYQVVNTVASGNNEVATVKFRYKLPDGDNSIEMVHPIANKANAFGKASNNLRFASAVTMFGMLLRNSEFKGNSSFNDIADIADKSRGNDPEGYRGEFVRLVNTAKGLNITANEN